MDIVIEPEVLLVNKPLEWTSFDVTNKLKRMLIHQLRRQYPEQNTKKVKVKVGHAGTLDPLATGLLIVCVGKETKNIDSYMGLPKEYTGSIYFGATRPSFDKETEIDAHYPMPELSLEQLNEASQKFLGEIEQIPPKYSAIKIDGVRAYASARKGAEPEMKARKVLVERFDITDINWPVAHFHIRCSKGTYIRSLAHDLGKELGGGAYLESLCRTKIGDFDLSKALSIEELESKFNS
ncbi:MAG: tRNA pseudouridine(55) synthase TruB [Bacteroidia bacterium]|nr:tRNA pseudouridine(55) synthase TruB [Bacteroidia bacterium]